MTSGQYLRQATDRLKSVSIPTARLDCLILMEHVLKVDRANILAEPDADISVKQVNLLNGLLEKRLSHMPIAYIVQQTEFYGRRFFVNDQVLVPRPESETMIDCLKWIINNRKNGLSNVNRQYIRLADVGTGCGALGITAALEVDRLMVDLIDIDSRALKVAQKNVVLHTIQSRVIEADLLPKSNDTYDILLCNLPYVPDDFQINMAASHEPRIAIFGGKDGLDVYRKLFTKLSLRQHKPLYILTESLPPSHSRLAGLAREHDYSVVTTNDFIQVYKIT